MPNRSKAPQAPDPLQLSFLKVTRTNADRRAARAKLEAEELERDRDLRLTEEHDHGEE